MYIQRKCPILEALKTRSVLLLGPRRTGKSAFIRHELKADKVYNLLLSDVFLRLSQRPSVIRESLEPHDKLIVIDEIQKLPSLMDEVHFMIEEFSMRFLLTGSSERKLKRTHTSLMAGRAKTVRLLPFVSAEVPDFDLDKVLLYGTLPPIYFSENPADELASYVGDYLQEEIKAEALARNIESFSRFLHRAALSSGEVINFECIASDAQVPARTIREYYAVLEATLIGTMLHPVATIKRKAIAKGKFYFFDVGVVNALIGHRSIATDTTAFGAAFEHFMFQELFAYKNYQNLNDDLCFWRTTTQIEVDFVIGNVAIEVKASSNVTNADFKGLHALSEELPLTRKIIVSREPEKRQVGEIEIYPYRQFLSELWSGQVLFK
jgi:predicted AAA+ superfamily ATPase